MNYDELENLHALHAEAYGALAWSRMLLADVEDSIQIRTPDIFTRAALVDATAMERMLAGIVRHLSELDPWELSEEARRKLDGGIPPQAGKETLK